jgi:hypothetical protein
VTKYFCHILRIILIFCELVHLYVINVCLSELRRKLKASLYIKNLPKMTILGNETILPGCYSVISISIVPHCIPSQVIQFEYGGDNLDPMMMEGNGKPVDFARILDLVRANHPYREEENLGRRSCPGNKKDIGLGTACGNSSRYSTVK